MNLSISFTNSDRQGSYFPGQILRGILSVQLTSDTKIGSISIGCLGIGEVFPPPMSKLVDRPNKQEIYLDDMSLIFNFNEDTDLPATKIRPFGEHLFPFSCTLPENIPSSFESPQGFIRYKLTAYIEGPEYDLQIAMAMFTVNAIYDLNKESKSLKVPSTVWYNEDACFYCFKASSVRAVATINRKAYVPGERIIITGRIENLTRHPVVAKATLVQKIKYHYKNSIQILKRDIAEVVRGSIAPHAVQVWRDEPLLIPPVAASMLNYCNKIDVWYKLYFCIYTQRSVGTKCVTLKLPIIIGTVPLIQHLDTFESGSGDGPLLDVDFPTPNFEPCIFGPGEAEKGPDFLPYTPLYATYSVVSEDDAEY